jgi:hypothetical protein
LVNVTRQSHSRFVASPVRRQTAAVEWVVGLGILAILVVARHIAARRVAKGDRRFAWLFFAPTLLMFSYLLWISATMWRIQPLVSIGVGLVAAVSLVLLARVARGMATGRETPELLGDLRGPSFDYLIWTAIGLPMLMVVVLVILLATGAFTNSR